MCDDTCYCQQPTATFPVCAREYYDSPSCDVTWLLNLCFSLLYDLKVQFKVRPIFCGTLCLVQLINLRILLVLVTPVFRPEYSFYSISFPATAWTLFLPIKFTRIVRRRTCSYFCIAKRRQTRLFASTLGLSRFKDRFYRIIFINY